MKSGCFKMLLMLTLCAAVLLGFTACETASPATRAQQNPAVFNSLSAEDRDLVLKGTISEGMTKDAVLLAWGRPSTVVTSSDNGRITEVWRYTSLQPVYRPHYGMGMGYGYGYRGRGYAYPYGAVGFGPDYVPVTSSIVRFRKNRVVGWDAATR